MAPTTRTDAEVQEQSKQLLAWAAQLGSFNGDHKKAKSVMGEAGNNFYLFPLDILHVTIEYRETFM